MNKGFNTKNIGMNGLPIKTIAGLVIAAVVGVVSVGSFGTETVKGNEVAVLETFYGGVKEEPLPPRTYFKNRLTDSYYHYDMSSQVFVMNDSTPADGEKGKGRNNDAYLVQSLDQQDMHININIRWRIDPNKVVQIHKTYHAHLDAEERDILEERLLRPAVMFIVKNHATKMKAMEAYSGEGLVALQSGIEKELANPTGDLRSQGIIVDNFVIEKIALDPNYTAEIKARQIAQQKKLRADEETKAAEADALKAKAVAQAALNKAVVEAESAKQVAILLAEQLSKSQVIAAEASKQQTVLAAEAKAQETIIASNAEKSAAEARASAIKALGEADAASQRLKFSAYSAPGAEIFAQIEIAKSMGQSLSGVQGYLPQGMSVSLLSDNFLNAVRSVMQPNKPINAATILPVTK